MPLRKLEKPEWQGYLDALSRRLDAAPRHAELERHELGNLATTDLVPLDRIAYDAQDDIVEVVTAIDGRMIRHPRQVLVDETPDGPRRIEVVDAQGAKEIIGLTTH